MKVTRKEFEEAKQLLDKKFFTTSMIFAVSDGALSCSLSWIIIAVFSLKINVLILAFVFSVHDFPNHFE